VKSLKYLNKYFWKYKWRLSLGILFAILSTFFGIYIAVLVRKATDYMMLAAKQNFSFDVVAKELLEYGLLIIGTTIVSGFLMFLMRQAIIVMSRHIEYDLKNEIFSHYQTLDTAFYRRNNTGDLMNRISEDVSRVRMYIGPAVMYFASTLATIILVSATMTGVNAKLTLFVLLPLPILVVVIYFVSDLINKLSNSVQEQLSTLSIMAQETFSGIRVLKAYVQESPSGTNFSNASGSYRKKYLKLILTESLFSPFILLLIGLSTIITIYMGGKQAIDGQISYGNIVEFVIYVNKLTWPVAALGWVTSLVQRAAASQKRINEFLETAPIIHNNTAEINANQNKFEGEVEFKNVSFTYPDSGIQALKNVSFKIESGKSLAIIGKTGSGKSTVAALICRLYDVSSGAILLDGKNIKERDLFSLRKNIGYVPQDTFLFSDTVENNIAFGINNETESLSAMNSNKKTKLIHSAAKNAGLAREIQHFPNKYNTMIGERGITLSGGQKQRIAIARAIVGGPQVLLFDDCLSSVDTETESEILGNLKAIMKGKTTIIISHRISTVKDADHIIAMNEGRIIEEGTHEALLLKKGFYFELYQKQLVEEVKSLGVN